MERLMKYLCKAALTFVGAVIIGCSSADDILPDSPQTVTLTTTISRGGASHAGTRALTPEGVKTFAVGEQIAVIYTNTASERVKAVSEPLKAGDITNDSKTATITVTLTNPVAGSVDYIYPAVMANDDGTANYSSLCMQDGTIETLSSKFDYAKGTGDMTNSGDVFTLPEGVSLVNQLTVCEFKIKNPSGTEITTGITSLTISDGTNTYTISPTGSPIYVAMQPVTSDKTISFIAHDGSHSYYKSVTGKALQAGEMTPVGVTMMEGQVIDLSKINANCTAQNGDMLTGKLGGNYQVLIADGATVVLNGVSINYESSPVLSGAFAGITCLGNATLIISGTDYVKGMISGYPGIFVPSGSTLTITGSGTLYALGHDNGAGIGSGRSNIDAVKNCGNIVIQGGEIWGTGGTGAAGIGSGAGALDKPSSCGYITIKRTVTSVYAQKGSGAESIGSGQLSTCGTVTIEDPSKVTKN